MARGKLSRASVSTLAASAPPPMPSRKRTASSSIAPAPAADTTPARQSKRIKSASATPRSSGTVTVQVTPKSAIKASPKKSQYFEEKQGRGKNGRKSATKAKKEVKQEVKEESEEEDEETEETEASAGDDDDDSGYEDEDASLTEPEPTEDEEAEEESEEEEKPRRKGGKKGKSTVKKVASNKKGAMKAEGGGGDGGELWREGVRSHLEPGEEVFIELPKARPAGKTPYRDETIHPNTLLFLADLKANNNRPWLKTHDADFRQAERDWKAYVEVLSERLINEVDETIPELPVKDIIFRIYRDIRFSPDPTPYKPHFSVAWSRTGRKGPYAVYYLQIGSNNTSFFGGGIWMPPADQIALLRRTIDTRADKLKSVLMQDGPRKSFLGGVPKDPKKVVKAFCASNKENALKKKPKDYDADHPEIELLKLKNFVMGRKLKDEEITGKGGKGGMDVVLGLMKDMLPWVTYLNSVLMPDPDADPDSDADGGEDGEDGEEEGEDGEGGEEDSDPGPDPDEPEGWEPQ